MSHAGVWSRELAGKLIAFGSFKKTTASLAIGFSAPYREPPAVVVTPFWENQDSEVGHAESIGTVSPGHFEVHSSNAADNYFVNWVAVGDREAPGGSALETGDLRMQWGRMSKPTISAGLAYGASFADTPSVQVSPLWHGRRSGVGHAETINTRSPESFEVYSDNRAPDYAVSWLAVGTAGGASPRRPYPDRPDFRSFSADDLLVRTGSCNKRQAIVECGLDFGAHPDVPPFAAPPIVIVTPFWDGQRRGVGHAETLSRVDRRSFRLASGNAADNYHATWTAIGLRG